MERRLGAGGFGVVWLAWDEKLEREVAVKVIPRERGAGERVEREARAAARLNHPGIVAIYELDLGRARRLPGLGAGSGPNAGGADPGGRACRPRRGPHRRGALRGAGARARARGDPPRREASERDGGRRARGGRGLREAGRLRRGARGVRGPADAHRRRGGHARLHGARAGRGRARDAGLRRLLAGTHALRGVDGHQPGQGERPRRHRTAPRAPAALARGDAPRPPARALRRRGRRAGGRPGDAPGARAAARGARGR